MKIVIVDDEFPARKLIRHYIEDETDIEIVGEYDNCEDAMKYINLNSVDIVFLDINMAQINGIDMAERINKNVNPPMIVFTTGFTEYAVKAFELNAIDYIVKPYTKSRIYESLKRVREAKNRQLYGLLSEDIHYSHGKLSAWDGNKMVVIKYSDIEYFSAAKKSKSNVRTEKGKYTVDLPLKDVEKHLDLNSFMRVHKSYIVNMEKITEVTPSYNNTYDLTMIYSCEKVPVSRHYIASFREKIGIKC